MLRADVEPGMDIRCLLGDSKRSFGFADVDVMEGFRDFSRANQKVSPKGKFSHNIALNLPVVTAPMPDVTDPHVAIVSAQNGALGILPATYSPEEQADGVRKVKKAEGTFVGDPFFLRPDATIGEAIKSPYSNIPIVEDGKLVGMYTVPYFPYTDPEFFYEGNMDRPLREVMQTDISRFAVPIQEVLDNNELNFEQASRIIRDRILHALAVVNDNLKLAYIVTMKDVISKQSRYRTATRDSKNRLCVGAAVLEHMTDDNLARISKLADAEVDVIVIEQAQGWNVDAGAMTAYLKNNYPHIDVVAGNDSVARAVGFHHVNRANGVKVGQGPGSECISGEVVGLWRPQLTVAYECGMAAYELGMPCTVDGGVGNAYHAFKALLAGGTAVMLGRLVAATSDSPAREEEPGKKLYRAMGSPELVRQHASAFHKYDVKTFIPEGRSSLLDITTSLEEFLGRFQANLERCFERFGMRDIGDMRCKLNNGLIRVQLAHGVKER